MINKNRLPYKCAVCGCPTPTLHEIFHGTHGRQVAIDYNIQAWVCNRHHMVAHGRFKGVPLIVFEEFSQGRAARYFCDWLGINFLETLRCFKTARADRSYLEEVKEKCQTHLLAQAL